MGVRTKSKKCTFCGKLITNCKTGLCQSDAARLIGQRWWTNSEVAREKGRNGYASVVLRKNMNRLLDEFFERPLLKKGKIEMGIVTVGLVVRNKKTDYVGTITSVVYELYKPIKLVIQEGREEAWRDGGKNQNSCVVFANASKDWEVVDVPLSHRKGKKVKK